MATDKRERKRTARDERLAAMQRQRNARLIAVGIVILVVIGLAVFASTGDDGVRGNDNSVPEPTTADAAACDAEPPDAADPQQYNAPPEMQLQEGVDYFATITTSCGEIVVDLLEEEAPETVNNFVFLAREGYFDGLIWHRVERNFVIQAGDPDGVNGQEPDGPGYSIKDELWGKSKDYIWGTLAMANSGPNTGGSQFFIIVHEPRDKPAGLPALYSIFGTVDESSNETLTAIATAEVPGSGDASEASKPIVPVFIETIEISEA